VGGSSGTAVWATLQYAKKMKKGQRVLTILPDGVRNYMTKFLDDKWMAENRFVDEPWAHGEVGDLLVGMPERKLYTVQDHEPVGKAVGDMKEHGISQLPVLSDDGSLVGILTETDVLTALFDDRCTMDTVVAEVMCRRVSTVSIFDDATRLAEVFLRGEVAVVMDEQCKLRTLLSKLDLIEHLSRSGVRH
jgi:cystathionine beta-synthase